MGAVAQLQIGKLDAVATAGTTPRFEQTWTDPTTGDPVAVPADLELVFGGDAAGADDFSDVDPDDVYPFAVVGNVCSVDAPIPLESVRMRMRSGGKAVSTGTLYALAEGTDRPGGVEFFVSTGGSINV